MSTPDTTGPRMLGRYELVHPLGQGGMGEVWLAKLSGAAGFEKPCIVKTVLPQLLSDRQFLDRFHHEAKVLVHLVHSNIAQVYDMGEAAGVYFMALEYVAGVDLATLYDAARTARQHLPVPVVLHLAQQMAEGLGYAHRKAGADGLPLGIVHRDVSPHNAMVSYEGEVKVIDFGLAKSAARSAYTLPSTVMGKLGYMSPEQARGEPLDPRSDIYSAGVVLWELLAGEPLVPFGTTGEMVAAMAHPRPRSVREVRPDVPEALDAVVLRALAPDREQRYARADDLARALAGVALGLGSTLGAEEVGTFVRTLCPERYAGHQRLLSKLSSSARVHHRTPVPLEAGAGTPQPRTEADPGLAPTQVRPVTPTPQVETRPTPVAAVSPLPAQAPKQGVGVLALAVAGVVLLGGVVGGTVFAVRWLDREKGAAVPVQQGRAAVAEAPVQQAVPGGAAQSPAGANGAAPASGSPAQAAVAAPATTPLAAAEPAPAAAGAETPAAAPVAEAPASGPAPVATAPAPTKPAGRTRTATTSRRGAPAPTPASTSVTPAPQPAVAVAPKPAPPPSIAAPAPVPSSVAFAQAPRRKLSGRIERNGSKAFTLVNQDSDTWSECIVMAPEQRVARVAVLGIGKERKFELEKLTRDADARDLPAGTVVVECLEGFAEFKLR